jgi:4'-phosphopantetheinyl transferase
VTAAARDARPRGATVHVWSAELDAPQWPVARFEPTLSTGELQRAGRYRFAVDRRRFVVRRALLRLLLSRETGADPPALEFCQGPAGKPELAPSSCAAGLHFNLSHTRGLALFAVARGPRVGVDVEALRPLADLEAIARTFLSAWEQAALRALPADVRNQAFFVAWTRKEALLKATGEGLTLSPERIEVTVAPHEPALLRAIEEDLDAAARWTLRTLPVGRTHAGTVAVEGRVRRLFFRHLAPLPRADAAVLAFTEHAGG